MYGSSFTCVTLRPRASSSAPTDALASPFPMEETTPPVTNTYLVGFRLMPGILISTPHRGARGGASPRPGILHAERRQAPLEARDRQTRRQGRVEDLRSR